MNHPGARHGGLPPDVPAGTAVLKFERGETRLALFRRRDGFLWFHGRKPFSRPLATTAAAVQFLRDLCGLYNFTLDLTLLRSTTGRAATQVRT